MLAMKIDERTDVLIETPTGEVIRLKFSGKVRIGLQGPRNIRVRRISSRLKEAPARAAAQAIN